MRTDTLQDTVEKAGQFSRSLEGTATIADVGCNRKETASEEHSENHGSQFVPWTQAQVREWRERQPPGLEVLPLMKAQLLVGVLTVMVSMLWGWSASASALYGSFAVLLPAWLMVWRLGMLNGVALWPNQTVQAWVFGRFFMWEGVKILLTVVMLGLAPWFLSTVNWLALVLAVIAVSKAYWIYWVLWMRKSASNAKE